MSNLNASLAYRHFRHVLILSNVEVHARRDRLSMKAFAPDVIRVVTTASDGIDYLSSNPVDLVICDMSLGDMDGLRFLQLVRKNMNLKKLPVVMVTLENRKNHVLDAISLGCTGYVLRPYSMETLERHVLLAMQLERYSEIEALQLEEAKDMVSKGDFDDAIEAFEEIISIQDEAQNYYDLGCKHLLQQKYGKAIVAFRKAIKINDLFAEAYKGLADAYRGKGDHENYMDSMKKAAEIYAQFDRLEETKNLFIEILKHESQTPNPYNTLGVKLRKQGDYPGALHAYRQALELTPEDENILFNMSKAYYFMGDLDKAKESLATALSRNSHFREALKLYARVAGSEWRGPPTPIKEPPPPTEPGKKSAMDL